MRTIRRKSYSIASIITLTGSMIFGLIILSAFSPLYASYYSIGVGNGGDAKTKNITIEAGSNEIRIPDIQYLPKTSGKRFLGAVGLTFMDHRKRRIPPDTLNSSCPHNEYTSLGWKPKGMEMGLLGKFGMELFHSDIYLSFLTGITRAEEAHIVQSNSTGSYYKQSQESKMYGMLGISIGYFPQLFDWKAKLALQVDYDNRRGVTGSVGWRW